MTNVGLHAIISSELLAGLLGMISATVLAQNIAKFLRALIADQMPEKPHSLVQRLQKQLSKKNYHAYESLAGSVGYLFVALDIIFVKQINFLAFFVCMSIPQTGYYLLFPNPFDTPHPPELPGTVEHHAILANKFGYGLVFLGALMTFATAYLQYKYYSVSSIKGSVFTAMGVFLLTTSAYGWVISVAASRGNGSGDKH